MPFSVPLSVIGDFSSAGRATVAASGSAGWRKTPSVGAFASTRVVILVLSNTVRLSNTQDVINSLCAGTCRVK